jgi:hypothetical protein
MEEKNCRAKKDIYFNFKKNIKSLEKASKILFGDEEIMDIRVYGDYKYNAIYLDGSLNWKLKKDNQGVLCLIPTKDKE